MAHKPDMMGLGFGIFLTISGTVWLAQGDDMGIGWLVVAWGGWVIWEAYR